jgi:chromosome segregation ATPase
LALGAAGTAFGALLHFATTRRKDKMTAHDQLVADHRELSQRLQRELGRLDAICERQQEEINGKEGRIASERRLKHDCNNRLQQMQLEKDELVNRLMACGVYINELEFKLARSNTDA